MFNGEEDYKVPYMTGGGLKETTPEPINIVDVEPPSAERMLKLMRKKITGRGLKEL